MCKGTQLFNDLSHLGLNLGDYNKILFLKRRSKTVYDQNYPKYCNALQFEFKNLFYNMEDDNFLFVVGL